MAEDFEEGRRIKPYNPFELKTVKDKANKKEKKLAKDFGGRRQPMSGALDGMKGDIVTEDFLFDSKMTGKTSINVSTEMLAKISGEAYGKKKYPVLVLSFEVMPEPISPDWVVLSKRDFEEIMEKLNGNC